MRGKQEAPPEEIAGALCDSFAGMSPIPHGSDSNWAHYSILAAHCGTDWLANLASAPLGGGQP